MHSRLYTLKPIIVHLFLYLTSVYNMLSFATVKCAHRLEYCDVIRYIPPLLCLLAATLGRAACMLAAYRTRHALQLRS